MESKNRKNGRIVMITRKEVELQFMNSIERPPTPEDIMIRNEENTLQSGQTKGEDR